MRYRVILQQEPAQNTMLKRIKNGAACNSPEVVSLLAAPVLYNIDEHYVVRQGLANRERIVLPGRT